MGLKGSWRAPTWKALFSSLIIVGFYYALLYWLRHYYVDFAFHIPGFAVYMLGYIIALLFYFRLNNSYYRWNDGYKSIAYLRANMDTFTMKTNAYLLGFPEDQKYLGNMMKNFARSMRDIVRDFQDPHKMIEAEKKATEALTSDMAPKGPVFMDSGVDVVEDADGDSDDESDIDMDGVGMKVTFNGELDFNAQKETFEKEFIITSATTTEINI